MRGSCLARERTRGGMGQLLYVHGSGHTRDAFEQQVAAFHGSRALSLPGHPFGRPLDSVAEIAAWLAREIEAAANGPAVICGNSLGAAVALECTLTHPAAVAGLIIIGGGARLRVGPQIFAMIDERWPVCIDELVGYSVSADCPSELRARMRGWHELVGQTATRTDYRACDAFDVMDRIGNIVVPTLVVVGTDDRMTPPKYAAFLHRSIQGSRLVTIDGSGHVPHLERPDAVNAAIREWRGSFG
jgi:pimeloyl-ACP methyl ester carboxylesterase